MTDYEVLSVIDTGNPIKKTKAARIKVLINAETIDDATTMLRNMAADLLGENDMIVMFAYIERDAVKWNGYIARVEHGKNEAPKIYFDNNAELRRALYQEFSA